MLSGPELGAAIRLALKEVGLSTTTAAARYGIKKSSVSGWFSTGRISTDILIDIMDLCSPKLGPEHWGLKSWPGQRPRATALVASDHEAPYRDRSDEQSIALSRRLLRLRPADLEAIEIIVRAYEERSRRETPKANGA